MLYPSQSRHVLPLALAATIAVTALPAAPARGGLDPAIQPQIEGEVRMRRAGSSAAARLAIPAWKALGHTTIFQVGGAKGEASLGGVSAGVIQRFRPAGGDWVFGLNAFYEALQTADSFEVQQFVLGVEIARPRHILRAHAWLPITGGETRGRRGGERLNLAPTRGVDVEYEVDLPVLFGRVQPRAAAGYSWLQADGAGGSRTIAGFKGRVELQYEWLTAGVEWREDARAVGGHWLGFVRVSVPLGREGKAESRTALSRMEAPIRRDSWPLTLRSTRPAPAPPAPQPAPAFRVGAAQSAPPAADVECCGGAPDVLIFD